MMNCEVTLTFIYRSHFRLQMAIPQKKIPFLQPKYIFSLSDDFLYRIVHCTRMYKCTLMCVYMHTEARGHPQVCSFIPFLGF